MGGALLQGATIGPIVKTVVDFDPRYKQFPWFYFEKVLLNNIFLSGFTLISMVC